MTAEPQSDPILDPPVPEVVSDDVRECRHCGHQIGRPHRPTGVGAPWFHLDRPESGAAYCGDVGDSPTAAPVDLVTDPAHLAPLYAAGLDGIARALEVEATAQPGIGRDDATARIDGWLRPPTPAAGPADRRAGGDGYGLGATSPTA